jgi:divalent metal cation (Fe/Co/Zn/Cd) transporter
VSIIEGILKVLDPHPVSNPVINYVVLGVAGAFEAGAWTVAYLEFRKQKGTTGIVRAIRRSKDPTVFTVLFEDTAAMLGLIVAFLGIWLGQLLDLAILDAVASLIIGLILAVTAMLLAYECKGLLIGEGASRDVVAGIREIVDRQSGILAVNETLTMHFGPEDILLNLSVDFADALDSDDVERAVSALESEIKGTYPQITKIFIEAQNLAAHRRDRVRSAAAERAEGRAEGG